MAMVPPLVITAKDKTGKAFKSLNRSISKTKSSMGGMTTAVVALAGPAAMGMLIKNSMKEADALGKLSDKIGITTEALTSLQRQATQAGASEAGLNKALEQSQKRLGEAAMGAGEAAKYIKELGLNLSDLQAQSPDQVFATYADAISGLETSSEKMAAANALMGRTGADMLVMLNAGSEGMKKAREESDALGLALNRVEVKQIENANDSMDDFMRVIKSVGDHLAKNVGPMLSLITAKFTAMAKESGGVGKFVDKIFMGMVKGAAFVSDGVQGVAIAWSMVKAGGLNALAALMEPIAAISYRLAQFKKLLGEDIDPMETGLVKVWQDMKSSQLDAFDEMSDALDNLGNNGSYAQQLTKGFKSVSVEAEKTAMAQIEANNKANQVIAESNTESKEAELSLFDWFTEKRQTKSTKLLTDEQKKEKKYNSWSVKEAYGKSRDDLAILAQSSKKAFETMKAARIAEAIVNAHASYNETMSKYPYPFNVGMAALSMAASMAQVSAIRATSFGGGGGGGGTASAMGIVPESVAPGTAQPAFEGEQDRKSAVVDIQSLMGEETLISTEGLRSLMGRLTEEFPDGVTFAA